MSEVQKFGVNLPISRELALDYGLVSPTPAEQAERAARAAEARAEREAARPVLRAAVLALDAVTDQPARLILDLHGRVVHYHDRWRCDGCDMSGYECEAPDWPCRTTRELAGHYGVVLPEWYLERPEDGSLDLPA